MIHPSGWRAGVVANNKATIRDVLNIPARWRRKVIADAICDELKPWLVNDHCEKYANPDLHAMRELNDGCLPLNASDDDICNASEARASECARALPRSHCQFGALRAALTVCDRWRVGHPRGETMESIYKRCCCPLWWRRSLRRAHARQVEAVAIESNIVHKRGDKYVSLESLERRQQMAARTLGMLENVIATNEDGDSWSLAELAALSVSNPSIRRGELMVRIRGLEELAAEAKHVAEFVTLTCPSRMHAVQSTSGERNHRYDGTMPREAQAYLRDVWARCRSAFVRAGLRVYGLRVAEPHHDGCPHWHLLVFMGEYCGDDSKRRAVPRYRAIMRRYGLEDSGAEAGAVEHRVKFVSIDTSKGTAAGYVAKYISKAVGDVDVDAAIAEYGINADAKVRAKTGKMSPVAAWAKTHGIRQFQFFGTPPVGFWRAWRRVHGDDIDALTGYANDAATTAYNAVHKLYAGDVDDDGVAVDKPADYAAHVRWLGGVYGWRSRARMALCKESMIDVGARPRTRYGEYANQRVIGIVLCDSWDVVVPLRIRDWEFSRGSKGRRAPWTRFNNCTDEGDKNVGSGYVGDVGSGVNGDRIGVGDMQVIRTH